jgi:hypothetical protein
MGKVCQRVVDVAFEALLDAVCAADLGLALDPHLGPTLGPTLIQPARDPHVVSARSFLTSYLGMVVFIIVVAPLIYAVYITRDPGSLVSHSI